MFSQRHFILFCVHFLFVCVHMALSIRPRARFTEKWFDIFFLPSLLENCEQTRKVEANESDRIFRIMNVFESQGEKKTVFVDVAMDDSLTVIRDEFHYFSP